MLRNLSCSDQEFTDIIQCYLDSEKKIDLCQLNYFYRYPERKICSTRTIKSVIQTYLDSTNASTSLDEENGEVRSLDSDKDDRIIKYFLENRHASIKKASSIFHMKCSYIEKLLEENKVQIKSKKKGNVLCIKKMNSNDCITENFNNNKQDHAMVKDKALASQQITAEENIYDDPEIKVEIDIVENDPRDSIRQEHEVPAKEEIHCEDINTNKRKPETLNSEVNKKLKTYLQNMTTDKIKLEKPFVDNLLVYTTRLEDMAILKRNIRKFDRALVIKKILLESKPKFYHSSQILKSTVRKRKKFTSLRKKLKVLGRNKICPIINLTEDSFESKVIDRVGYPACKALYFNIEDNIIQHNNCNIVIVINNKSSQLWDIYVIDSNGNIVEYHSTKSEDVLNDIDPSKLRLKLDACCWYQRRLQIHKTWPLHETTFARFLMTTHKCPPGLCTCCCKPNFTTSKTCVLKNVFVNATNALSLADSNDEYHNQNLIRKALMYQRNCLRNNENSSVTIRDSPPQLIAFSEDVCRKDKRTCRTEIYEIGTKQEILFQAVLFNMRCRTDVGPDVLQIITKLLSNNKNQWKYSLEICCKFKRDTFLQTKYSEGNISESVLRYLRKTIFPYICDKCKKIKNSIQKYSNDSNLVLEVPSIEHTGTSKVLKIEAKRSCHLKNLADQTLTKSPSTGKLAEKFIEPLSKEMDQLELICKQIPGISFTVTDIHHKIATAIATKFTSMDFTIATVEGKSVASLNIPGQSMFIESTSNDEFKVMANIILNLQNRVQELTLPPETKLSFDVKIKSDNTVSQNYDYYPSNINKLQTAHQGTENAQKIDNNVHKNMGNNSNAYNICADNSSKTSYDPGFQTNTDELKISNQRITDSILNKLLCSQNQQTIVSNSICNQNIGNIKKNLYEVYQDSCTYINPVFMEIFDEQLDTNKNVYDNFKNIMIYSKKCSANSFRLYRKLKEEICIDNGGMPLITNVFSLKTINSETNEQLSLTKKAPIVNTITERNKFLPSLSEDPMVNIISKQSESLPSTSKHPMAHRIYKGNKSLPSTHVDPVIHVISKGSESLPSTSEDPMAHIIYKGNKSFPSTHVDPLIHVISKGNESLPSTSEDPMAYIIYKGNKSLPSTHVDPVVHVISKGSESLPSTSEDPMAHIIYKGNKSSPSTHVDPVIHVISKGNESLPSTSENPMAHIIIKEDNSLPSTHVDPVVHVISKGSESLPSTSEDPMAHIIYKGNKSSPSTHVDPVIHVISKGNESLPSTSENPMARIIYKEDNSLPSIHVDPVIHVISKGNESLPSTSENPMAHIIYKGNNSLPSIHVNPVIHVISKGNESLPSTSENPMARIIYKGNNSLPSIHVNPVIHVITKGNESVPIYPNTESPKSRIKSLK